MAASTGPSIPPGAKIFIVVDPTDENHSALERAIITAQFPGTDPELYIFLAVDGEAIDTSADNDRLYRSREWFLDLIKPLDDAGLKFRTGISWSHQWQESILHEANKFGANLIVFPSHERPSTGPLFSDSKWALLRNATCPVLITYPSAEPERKCILAAIKMQAKDDKQQELNEGILARGQWMADMYDCAFHVVNSYGGSMDYPDRAKLIEKTGLPPENIHVKQGDPEDVIAETASELNADIVVIGTKERKGLAGALRGNTSEKVISRLHRDVLTIS